MKRSAFSVRRSVFGVLVVGLFLAFFVSWQFDSALAQTNVSSAASATSNALATAKAQYRLPAPSDFQRLQFYYASQPDSPAPGTERGIWTLKEDRTWSGDWHSKLVARPTRAQLDAITPQQVDLFRRAATFRDGAWQIATSRTNIPLSQLSVTASDYSALRVIIERDQAWQKYQQTEAAVQALPSPVLAPATEAK
jgi:hypothetical protein